MIANERSGQGRYCSRVQSSAVVGRRRLAAGLRAHVAAKPKAPALPAVVLLRRSVRLCWLPPLLGPTSSSCIDDQGTGVPRLCLYCCCPPCGPRPGARSCMPNSTTRLVPRVCERKALTARHTQCSTQLAHRPARHGGLRASLRRGRGQGGVHLQYSTVQLTREGASLARDGVA